MCILNHLRENLTCIKFAHWENALACGYNSHWNFLLLVHCCYVVCKFWVVLALTYLYLQICLWYIQSGSYKSGMTNNAKK